MASAWWKAFQTRFSLRGPACRSRVWSERLRARSASAWWNGSPGIGGPRPKDCDFSTRYWWACFRIQVSRRLGSLDCPIFGRFYAQTLPDGPLNKGITAGFSSVARYMSHNSLKRKSLIQWSLFDQGNGFAFLAVVFARGGCPTHRLIHTFCG